MSHHTLFPHINKECENRLKLGPKVRRAASLTDLHPIFSLIGMAERMLKPGFYKTELNRTKLEIPDRYQNLKLVGAGACGQVCSAEDTSVGKPVAIKKIKHPFQSAMDAKRTYREIKMLKHMNHDNIIQLLDIFTPSQELGEVYMVTPLMDSDLSIILNAQQLTDNHVQIFTYQILRAVKYLHSVGIIHRDLKPANIAVNKNGEIKIIDFGLARLAGNEMTGYVVTRWYRAPEVLLNWMHYNQAVDIWSVGCIMAELLTGKALFPGNDHIDQLKKIMNLVGTPSPSLLAKISEDARNYILELKVMPKQDFYQRFVGISRLAIDLLEKMLDLDPDTRITAEGALAHGYLQAYADVTEEPVSEQYDQSFDDKEDLSVEEWKELVYKEITNFEPRQIDLEDMES